MPLDRRRLLTQMSLTSPTHVTLTVADVLPGPCGAPLRPSPYLGATPSSGAISLDVVRAGTVVARGVPELVTGAVSSMRC